MLPSALACGGDRYDGSEELKAIERALRGNSLPRATRRRVEELFKMASLPTQSLALKGLLLQSEIRGEALKELGLERIPASPALEFETIDKGMSQLLIAISLKKLRRCALKPKRIGKPETMRPHKLQ